MSEPMTVEVVERARVRRDLVAAYANLIVEYMAGVENPHMAAVNNAIIAKWSMAGLEWIKREAWKAVAVSK
jgi:hypothetical protein